MQILLSFFIGYFVGAKAGGKNSIYLVGGEDAPGPTNPSWADRADED